MLILCQAARLRLPMSGEQKKKTIEKEVVGKGVKWIEERRKRNRVESKTSDRNCFFLRFAIPLTSFRGKDNDSGKSKNPRLSQEVFSSSFRSAIRLRPGSHFKTRQRHGKISNITRKSSRDSVVCHCFLFKPESTKG